MKKTLNNRLRIAVDVKNFSLYSGGISAFFYPLLKDWINNRSQFEFILVGPKFDDSGLGSVDSFQRYVVRWPTWIPRFFRHPFYDNWLFPRAIKAIKPDFIFTPYHDVRLPKGIPSIMMIHDTCIGNLPGIYPCKVRQYYQHMLKINLSRCAHILTVSNTSKESLMKQYGLPASKIDVVPNSFEMVQELGAGFDVRTDRKHLQLFYAGGADHRKNVKRLVQAVELISSRGVDVSLFVTGKFEGAWSRELAGLSAHAISKVTFLGRLDVRELNMHYASADAVVYPTLCEGFGRVCLEAMSVGTPLACSDLPVLREVAGDYPVYFDAYDVESIVEAILLAVKKGRQPPCLDERFSREKVSALFLETVDNVLQRECALHA